MRTICMIVQMKSEDEVGDHVVSVTTQGRDDLVLANDLFLNYCKSRLKEGHQVRLTYSDNSLDLELIAVTQQCKVQVLLLTPIALLRTIFGRD